MIKTSMAAALLAAVPSLVAADGMEITGTVGVNLGSSVSQGTDPYGTVEGSIDLSYNGFHAGLWAGSLYQDPSDDVEAELSFGYGGDIGANSYWDVTYTHYFLNQSGSQGYDLTSELGTSVSDSTDVAIGLVSAPADDLTDYYLYLETALNEKWSASAEFGTYGGGAANYAELILSYAVSDALSLSLTYNDATDDDAYITLGASYEFSLR
jgi:uncharacterized protein (TIGR02001 family)